MFRLGEQYAETLHEVVWNEDLFQDSEDDPIGYLLQMKGSVLRSDGCLLASYSLTDEHIADLRPHAQLTTSQKALWSLVVQLITLLHRQIQNQTDVWGNPLPTSIGHLFALFDASDLYRKQGDTSEVHSITIDRQVYFLKQSYQPNLILYHEEAFRAECAMNAVLNILPWKLGPQSYGMFIDASGRLTYLSSKVPGITMTDIRKAASRVSLLSVQLAVLSEFLCNCQDRHHNNAFIDRYRSQVWLIDFANSFAYADEDMLILPTADLRSDAQLQLFTRALWTWHPERLQTPEGNTLILPDVLFGMVQSRDSIVNALHHYDIPEASIRMVQRRLSLLELLLQEEEVTLELLNMRENH